MNSPGDLAEFIIDNPIMYVAIGGGAQVKTVPVDRPLSSALVIAQVWHPKAAGLWWMMCLVRSGRIAWVPVCYAQP